MKVNHFKNTGYRDLEKKLDRIFSEYVRLKAADENGYCKCITCGKIYHWKEIHCGHFISRAVMATRFDETNCNPQCVNCNTYNQGKWLEYEHALIEKHGIKEVEHLKMKAKIGGKPDLYMLQTLIVEYREKVKLLKLKKGL